MGQESTALPFSLSFHAGLRSRDTSCPPPSALQLDLVLRQEVSITCWDCVPMMLWGEVSPYPWMEAGDQHRELLSPTDGGRNHCRELPSPLNSSFGDRDCVWGDDQGSDLSNSQCWCRYPCCKTMPWEGLIAPWRGRLRSCSKIFHALAWQHGGFVGMKVAF